MSKLLLAHGARCINLVAEDEEWHLVELLNGEKRVELGLRLWEAFNVDSVD